MNETDDRARRDERTVEMVLALLLGVGSFLGLVVLGWAVDEVMRASMATSLAPVAPGLLLAATVMGLAGVVRHVLRARRRGLWRP